MEPFIESINRKSIIENCYQQPRVADVTFLTCHNLKDKLIKKYVTVRLQLICKKLRQATSISSCSSGMASRSVAMRARTKL
jgi:hypothetical protein